MKSRKAPKSQVAMVFCEFRENKLPMIATIFGSSHKNYCNHIKSMMSCPSSKGTKRTSSGFHYLHENQSFDRSRHIFVGTRSSEQSSVFHTFIKIIFFICPSTFLKHKLLKTVYFSENRSPIRFFSWLSSPMFQNTFVRKRISHGIKLICFISISNSFCIFKLEHPKS